ncbi:TPA: hypothetical protein ACX96Z_000141 [Clostridium sporogenes]
MTIIKEKYEIPDCSDFKQKCIDYDEIMAYAYRRGKYLEKIKKR